MVTENSACRNSISLRLVRGRSREPWTETTVYDWILKEIHHVRSGVGAIGPASGEAGRLAAVRFPRPQRAGPPRARHLRPTPSCRAAGSTSCRPRASRASSCIASNRTPSTACPAPPSAYLRWQELEAGVAVAANGLSARGDGVCAAQRQPLRLARRCRHGRTGPLLRRRDRLLRRPGPAVRGVLGRRAVGRCTWKPPSTRARPTMSPSASSPSASATAVRCARPKCSSASWITSPHTASSPIIRPSVAVGPHSGDPHYAPGPDSDAPIRQGDFVLIDLWAKLDKPRAVYSDLTWTGFVGTEVPREVRDDFPHRRPRARCRHRAGALGVSAMGRRCTAGRWIRRPAM